MDTATHLQPRGGDPFIIAAPSVQPYTTPALTANLVFRIMLGLVANITCLVPLRLLYRNSELAAVIFIINNELKNFETVLYALLWRNDDMDNWWPGYGLCDISPFFHNSSIAIYATCMLAITRNLAHQVGLMRANPLTVKEKRRRNLAQALIILPLPLLQLSLTWFLTTQRYAIGTLTGCAWVVDTAWPYLVFFILAPVVVSTITVGYAVLTYFRFREVAKTTASALSSNRVANNRAQRARRRLYLMVVSILTPYFPVMVGFCVWNIKDMGLVKSYDYDRIHNSPSPYPWNSILYLPSSQIPFIRMNYPYISILTAIPVVIFFGMTKDAMNDYRRILLSFGLGRFFPRLYHEYDPDRRAYDSGTFGSGLLMTENGSTDPKFRSITSSTPLSTFSSSSGDTADQAPQLQSLNFMASNDIENGQSAPIQRPEAVQNTSYDATMRRNPFLFRTNLDFPVPFSIPFFKAHNKTEQKHTNRTHSVDPLGPSCTENSRWTADSSGIRTRVWSDDEAQRLYNEDDAAADKRSVSSAQGVHVETMLTRETHEANDC